MIRKPITEHEGYVACHSVHGLVDRYSDERLVKEEYILDNFATAKNINKMLEPYIGWWVKITIEPIRQGLLSE